MQSTTKQICPILGQPNISDKFAETLFSWKRLWKWQLFFWLIFAGIYFSNPITYHEADSQDTIIVPQDLTILTLLITKKHYQLDWWKGCEPAIKTLYSCDNGMCKVEWHQIVGRKCPIRCVQSNGFLDHEHSLDIIFIPNIKGMDWIEYSLPRWQLGQPFTNQSRL